VNLAKTNSQIYPKSMGANALCYLFRKTMITLIVMMNDYSGY